MKKIVILVALLVGMFGGVTLKSQPTFQAIANVPGSSQAAGAKYPLHVMVTDTSGNPITSFGGSGGTSATDDGAFTLGSANSITPAGWLVDNTAPDAIDEGDVGVARMSLSRVAYAALANEGGTLFATVRDTGASDSLNVAITDAAGNQITSFGGGTQYTEADTDATITGTVVMWEDTADTLRAASAANPLPVNIISGAGSGGTAAADDSAFTLATTNVTVMGCIEATDALDAGDLGGVKCGSDRELDIDVVSSTLPTGASTLAEQQSQTTALQLIDNAAGTTPADNFANPTGALATFALMGCWDGATWDRCPISTGGSGTIDANTARVTIATDDAVNDALVDLDASLVAHDAVDAGSTLAMGLRAIAHGTNPTAVAAADRTVWYANRAGVPFVIGGHPNVITLEAQVEDADGAQTDAALVTVSAGAKIVVTRASMKCDGGTTGPTNAVLGFGATTIPARAHTGVSGIVAAFDGIPAGGGSVEGAGSGILGVGADDDDLRLTMEDPVGGACSVTVSYYTIDS